MRPTLRTEWLTLAVVIAMVAGACTMKKQEAPPLTGPSEFGTSIVIEIRPDVLTMDGFTSAAITVTARNENGQPKSGVDVRLETIVNNANVDFGTLSQKNVRTGSDGKAAATYTPPASGVGGSELVITIRATPIGGNANVAVPRSAAVRLVPQGVVNPPAGLAPAFTSTPETPVDRQTVLFDANSSTANTTITSYSWTFGNGRSASGVTASTVYDEPGGYFVTLTIRDEFGRSASTTKVVTVVAAGTLPRAVFVFSPPSPVSVGTNVTFDASDSRPNVNATIVAYEWTFGDSAKVATSDSPTILKSYGAPGNYTVTLTIRDSLGESATTTRTITVQ